MNLAMEIENKDQEAQEANDQNNQGEGKKNRNVNQNSGTSWQTHSPTDQQPSASQNNEWQEDHGPVPDAAHQKSDRDKNVNMPGKELDAADEDDLNEEMPGDYRREDFIEENDLESTDQDYRDGENQAGEDQDDGDELRNGK